MYSPTAYVLEINSRQILQHVKFATCSGRNLTIANPLIGWTGNESQRTVENFIIYHGSESSETVLKGKHHVNTSISRKTRKFSGLKLKKYLQRAAQYRI